MTAKEGSPIQRINGPARHRTILLWLGIALMSIALLTVFGPSERTLGANVRVVYLHGAWVLAALAGFLAAGLVGAAGLITGRSTLHSWSLAFGRTGLFFWITYLPLSLWAMQTNWNGLFLSEPRWRLALIFAVAGLLLQMGLSIIALPTLTSAANLVYMVVLFFSILNVGSVMHPPPSPIFNSGIWQVQIFFTFLFALTLLAAWLLARWFFTREQGNLRISELANHQINE